MKVILKKIRQHAGLVLEFPTTGVVMLHGHSGAGKTTIFDAIYEALYGDAEDIQPWGESGSEVEVEIFAGNKKITIVRKRGPYSLTVTDEQGNEFIDDVGQSLINSLLGMNSQEFLSCSYIQQGMQGSLLTLPPAEQARFIHKLSSGDNDPESVKQKISDVIKKRQVELSLSQSQLSDADAALDNRRLKLNSAEKCSEEPVPPIPEHEILTAVARRTQLSKDALELRSDLKAIAEQLSNPIYKTIAILANRESRMRSLEAEILDDIQKNEENIKNIGQLWPSCGKTESYDKKTLIALKRKFFSIKKEMISLTAEVAERFPEASGRNLILNLEKITDGLSDKKQALLSEVGSLQAAIRHIESTPDHQECPECGTSLAVVGGTIVAGTNSNKEADLANTKKSLEQARAQISAIDVDLKKAETLCNKARSLKAALPESTLTDILTEEQLDLYESELIEYIRVQEKNSEVVQLFNNKINNLKLNLQKEKDEIAKLRSQIETTSTARPESELVSDQSKKQSMLEQITNEMADIEANISSYERYKVEYSNYLSQKKIRDMLQEDVDHALAKKTEAEAAVVSAVEALASATRLKELSDFASMSAVELIIESINDIAALYIDKMFPDDGTSIRIKNASQTKKGEDRAKISVEIFHKGRTARKLSALSGGEKSRAALAFQLALSEIYKSPFLLIDEGFSGLDEASKAQCLEVLRDAAKDKLLIVIEHGAPESFFDEVIRV